nr:unnamed protein product [Callosobruchus analis]
MNPCNIIKRSLSTTTVRKAITKITVIGGGLMGSGIAQVAAATGQQVTLVEVNADLLKKAEERIATSLGRVAKKQYKDDASAAAKFVKETISKIKGNTNPEDAVKDADLVIEAIVEKLEVKHDLFKKLDKAAPEKTIFASNTSSLSIGDIASVTNRKDRFGGLHFFNPVPVMKLLEVIRIPETSHNTYTAMMEWGKSIGKVCITCKDTPGFVVNRLLLGAGHPMGPIELADYVGHDTNLHILEGWHKKYPDNPLFVPCDSERELVRQGKLGVKAGEGYYKYNNLKYWVENMSKTVTNKRDWSKYYKVWKNKIRKQVDILYT